MMTKVTYSNVFVESFEIAARIISHNTHSVFSFPDKLLHLNAAVCVCVCMSCRMKVCGMKDNNKDIKCFYYIWLMYALQMLNSIISGDEWVRFIQSYIR